MPTFNTFSTVLPDPTNPITDAGDTAASGTKGPGFASVNFQSVTSTQVSRTISGRGVQRDGGSQHWEFSIQYNPMKREQFDAVDAFLQGRNPRKDPFYVILPQYSRPKDAAFATLASSRIISSNATYTPGTSAIMVKINTGTFTSTPRPGDMFTFSDASDYNHQKVYKVSAVEKNSYYQAGTTQPTSAQLRIHTTPPLQRALTEGAVLNFINPKFRVITKSDVQEYSLNTENLYSFSLSLEEIQP